MTIVREVPSTKRCRDCGDVKEAAAFTPFQPNKDGLFSYCKDCMNARGRARQKKLSAAQRERKRQSDQADYRKHHAERRHKAVDARLRSRYGITVADYDAMLSAQNGLCAICDQPSTNGKRLHVDHNHETGKVRGLLCTSCNFRLGLYEQHDWCMDAELYLAVHV